MRYVAERAFLACIGTARRPDLNLPSFYPFPRLSHGRPAVVGGKDNYFVVVVWEFKPLTDVCVRKKTVIVLTLGL